MPMGILFWILWILAAIGVFTGYVVAGIHVGSVLILVLFFLVGWKLFGPVLTA